MEIRAALESAVSEVEARESQVQEAPKAETPAEVTAPVEAVETEKPGRTAGRARDEQGRLLPGKAEKEEAPKEAAPAAPEAAVAAPVVQPIPRPSSWEKGMWGIWDKLNAGTPLDAKEARQLAEYSNKREGDYAKGVSTYKQEWDNAKPLLEAVSPFLPELQKHNIQPAQWISNLGRAHHTLVTGDNQSRLQQFIRLAQEYRVPIQALYDPQAAQQFVTEQVHQPAPQQDIGSLVRQELSAARMKDSIEQFELATNAAGEKLYPHFETVKSDMALLLEAGKAQDLKSAYSMSLRLHDDLWQSEQDTKRKADEAARLEANRKAVAAAKGSAVSVKSATPASAGAAPKKGTREQLSAAWDEHATGRV